MPIIIYPDDMKKQDQDGGWKLTTLADEAAIGASAIVARRWSFKPGVRSATMVHGNVEQLLYVIKGSGFSVVNKLELRLDPETVLWLEPGDKYQIIAGAEGLELLQGYPPEE
jgi:quercetin dioxygenase-like cupin family protein